MPTYLYRCNACENEFEEMHRIDNRKEPLSKPCPKCNTEGKIEQLLGASTPIVDPMKLDVGKSRHKPSQDFRDVMKKIKKSSPPSVRKNIKDY